MKREKKILLLFLLIGTVLLTISYASRSNDPIKLPKSRTPLAGTISIVDDRFDVKTDGSNTTDEFKKVLDFAVTHHLKVIVPPGTYTVANLRLPSETQIYFSKGSVMRLIDDAPKHTRCVMIDGVKNITITGFLEIDGNIDKVKAGDEHMHGLFIYNAKNVYIEHIFSYNSYGDNVSITGGSDRFNDYSENIYIETLFANRARRKNLVIEHVNNLTIVTADLDNVTGGTDNLGGNSIDVEPFDYTGKRKKFTINLGTIKTRGTGNDFSAGVSPKEAKNYIVNIHRLESHVLDLPTDDFLNSHAEKSALFCYGITINIDYFKVYLDTTITKVNGQYTLPCTAFRCQHASRITIKKVEIYGGYPNASVGSFTIGWENYAPIVKIDELLIYSPNVKGISVNQAELTIKSYIKMGDEDIYE